MNQDGYFEESLKMRNLLQEFDSGCSILGFREHIFTGSVSSVANYMALQELSFVSLGQRVLSQPLKIRQHYGHPDLFDKFFVMTEGWLLFVLYIPFHLSCIWSKFVILIEQSY